MKQLLLHKGKAGSTLVEVVVAIAILGLVTAPICSNMMVSARLNAKSRAMMAAQLQVSSAVEQLMAEGIEETSNQSDIVDPKLPGVNVVKGDEAEKGVYREILVTSEDDLVSVETIVKVKKPGGTT